MKPLFLFTTRKYGTIEIEDESYLIRGRPVDRDGKNLYHLKRLTKTHNVLHHNHQDYIEIDNKTKANKSLKKAKSFSPLFNGPYYVEAMFYVDPLNMPMTNEELISAAIQVDYILRDPTFQREAHFILKGIKQYSGPDIRTEEDLDIFCQYTADARANKEEDVSYLISAYEGQCLANADSYREATSFFVPQLDLHKVCRSWGLNLDLENSNCIELRCTSIDFNIDIPELLDFVPCNQLSNKLSSSQTGAFSRNDKNNQALCTKYDSSSIYTEFADNPCVLYCYVEHRDTYMNIGKAVDGTIARMENSLDMCLNGAIIPIGCDNQLSSTVKIDKCGICKGDNSQCVPFEDEKKIYLTNDMTDIANLDQNINVLYFKLNLAYNRGSAESSIEMGHSQWYLAYLDVQSGHLDDNIQHNMNLSEEKEERYLHLTLYLMSDNVLSSNFFIEHEDGNRTIYTDPNENYQFYRVLYMDKSRGIIVEDKKDNTMYGIIEIGDESYLIRGRSVDRDRKNLYHLKRLSKSHNGLQNDLKDYTEIDNKTKANKSFKKAKSFSPLFNGPYYVEAMFYVDPLNMPMTNQELISAAAQVDYILRDPTFQRDAHFILRGIKQYRGPTIKKKEDIDKFCQYTAKARARKEEDVSYLISANGGNCLANADSYRQPPSLFVPQLNLHKACRSWGLNLDLENSNCTDLRCTSMRFYRNIPELLNFLPCNRLSNKLSNSQTEAICYKGKCILKRKFQEKAGSWSSWSSWSKCRGDDTIGFAKRTRRCNNPRPKFGGHYCQGAKIAYKVCKNMPIGCDNQLSSTSKFDKCGTCKGDNSQCVPFEDEKRIILTNEMCHSQWSLAYLDVQSGHMDDIIQQNMNLPEEKEERFLHLTLYPITENVLSSDFFIEDKDGNRTIYTKPSKMYQSYRVFNKGKFRGIIVEDKKDNTMHGTLEIEDKSYLIKGRPVDRDRKNLYRLKRLTKIQNVLQNDLKDYIEIDNKTNANKSFKKARIFSPSFNGPYYVEAMFYVDPLNMTMTDQELISAAIQVDYILRDLTFQRDAHFILKGIKPYKGPNIRKKEDFDIFCQYTANARVKKEEGVSFLISADKENCLANSDRYRKTPSFFVPQFDLNKACRSRNLTLDLENSNCAYLRCPSKGYNHNIPELLNFLPCNRSSNKLSSSQTGAICYKGTCILHSDFQEKAGLWSSWSSWSQCRGDNTIGYSERTRECNNPSPKFFGRYCQGAKIEYKVCQNALNRNNEKNQALCTMYDNSSIYTEFADKPCVLYCYVKSYNIDKNIGKVVDGTLVRTENSLHMCLKGIPIPIGCDNQLSSTAKFDKCGICKGDNSQCVFFENEISTYLTNDMTDIANLNQSIKVLYFKLELRYYYGLSVPVSSIVLTRNGKKFTGTQIRELTDITYKIDRGNEIISSEKLSRPLIIQIKKNLRQQYITVNYKLKYAIPRN
ncbi:unnamed protein product [Gordionus sp. m RMFG-2023]